MPDSAQHSPSPFFSGADERNKILKEPIVEPTHVRPAQGPHGRGREDALGQPRTSTLLRLDPSSIRLGQIPTRSRHACNDESLDGRCLSLAATNGNVEPIHVRMLTTQGP
jgi:hypothetical protein